MARENRDQEAAAEGIAQSSSAPTPRRTTGPAGEPAPAGCGEVPSPAARSTGPLATPPPTPPVAASPPPTPPTSPPVALSQAPQSAVPSEDPGATGRNSGSRTSAPAATPAAPRGRDTTDRQGGHVPGDGHGPGRVHDGGHGLGGAERPGGEHGPGGAERPTGPAAGTGHGPGTDGDGPAAQLLGDGERDRLGQRLHEALAGFVDSPQESVAEAAEVLAEAERQLIASLKDRRAKLQEGWEVNGDAGGSRPDTEQLRLTLRTYREVTERLLRA
ncbi:hypothetical protein [Streptomyces sp. NPDC007355]|uniref:hypothetical protein n=1 Tax=Streptomyces sp. NPDC007355 TaxID=3364778 RepID=UPI00369520DB